MEDEDVARDDPPLRSDEATVPSSPTPQDVIAKMAEMEVDADAHEAAIDTELRGIAAAAAGEIDAFLAEAQKSVTPAGRGPLAARARAARASAELRRETSERNIRDERAVAAALAHYDGAKRALAELSARMERVQRTIDELEDDATVVRGEMDGTADEPDPGAVTMGAAGTTLATLPRRRRLEREAAEYAAEIAARTEELERLDAEVARARRELIDAEHDVVFVDDLRTAVAKREAAALVRDSARVADISRTDAEALRRYEAARHAAYARERTRREMVAERERFVVEAGRASRREAYKRVNEKLQFVREHLEAAAAMDRTRHVDDTRRLLELKHSTERAFEQVAKYVAAKNSFHEQRKADRRREAADLLAKGQNPYLVFQEREEARRVRAAERRNARNHAMRMEQIRARLSKEEKEEARRAAEAAKKKELDRMYTRTLGRRAREERTKKYMEGATRAGVDILDATGRNTVFPSQVSRVAPKSLGLGGLRDDPERRKMVADDVAPGAQPLDAMLTRRERELRLGEGVGVGSLGKEYEPSWNAGPDRGTGAATPRPPPGTRTSEATATAPGEEEDGDAPGLEEPEDEEAIKIRERRSALLRMESERLKAKAKERFSDPDRLYSSQVVCGREFAGDSFAPTPKRGFLFTDFEAGGTYRKKITLTNVSYSTGTFKVMDMEYPYSSLFDVEYAPPGRMSAGMSTSIHLTFTPRTMDPVSCHLSLSTNTGIVRVPVECRPKSAEVYLVNEELDFPETLVGQRAIAFAQLINEGAIPVPFACEYPVPAGCEPGSRDGEDGDDSPFTVRVRGSWKELEDGRRVPSAEGVVPGYGSAFIVCEFHPRRDGTVQEDVHVRLGAPLDVDAVIKLRAVAGPLPVHLDGRTTMDFKGVAIGCVYRDELIVKNRADVPARCVLRVPECLLGSCEIVPDMLFCQPGGSATFSVKMTPTEKTAERCKKHVNPETGCVEVPMKVTTPGQNLPVPFTLRALLTSSDLTFDPPAVDFGKVALGEVSAVKVKITNRARLMQTFGFSELPDTVSVAPSPYGEILAGETLEVELRYAPTLVQSQAFAVRVKTLLGGRIFDLKCVGRGVRPALEMTGNVVTLPPTAAREMSHGTVVIRNTSRRRTETFEFVVPDEASNVLRVSPHVGTLGPGQGTRVRVEFCPEDPPPPTPPPAPTPEPPELDEDGNPIEKPEKSEDEDADGDAEGDAGDADGAEAVEGEAVEGEDAPAPEPEPEPEEPPEPKRDVWRVPVFIKAAPPLTEDEQTFDPNDDDEWVGHPTAVQHVEVRAVTRAGKSSVVVDNLHEVPGSAELTYDLDFGHVAVGDRVVRSIRLRNLADTAVGVGMSAPDHEGVFTALTASRPMPPLGELDVKVAFQPGRVHDYHEIVTLKTTLRTIRVAMRGAGISPALDVEPSDVVDCGDAVPGDCKNATLTLTNPTAFPQRWRAEVRNLSSHGLHSRSPFTFSPGGGVIAPNGTCAVTLSFTPDAPGAPYGNDRMFSGTIAVVVAGGGGPGAETTRELRARCWADGSFVCGGDDDAGMSSPLPPSVDAVGLRTGLREPRPRAPYESIELTLPGPIRPGDTASASLHVGSVKNADGGGTNAEYAFESFAADDVAKGWSVDEPSGSVAAGDRKKVTFTFAYPSTPRPVDPCYFGIPETVRADVTCVLRGGLPAPAEEGGREVRVALRCRLLPPLTAEEIAAAEAEAEARKASAEEGDGGGDGVDAGDGGA